MPCRFKALCTSLALLAATSAPAGTVTYTYDAAGRLTRADYGDGKAILYGYDAMGNLLQRKVQLGEPQADVSIRKTGEPAAFELGRENLVYLLTVSNAGPEEARNVRVSDPLPANTLFALASTGQCAAGLFEAALGSLPAGGQTVIRIESVPLTAGTFINIATVTNDLADPNLTDNTAGFTNEITVAADTNANGLADWWEERYLPNPADRVATNDTDGDGVINCDEQAAGTDPMLSNDYPRIRSIALVGGPTVGFVIPSGRVFSVWGQAPLHPTSAWDRVSGDLPGRGAPTTVTDTNALPFRTYRLSGGIPP